MTTQPNLLPVETFNIIVWCWIAAAIIIFPFTLKLTAPYGRHSKSSWGPMISNNLAWIIMELPSLLIFSYFAIIKGSLSGLIEILASSMWVIHYFHRAVIFPFRIKTKGKKMPISIMFFAIFFNSVNGFLNGYWVGNLVPDNVLTTGLIFRMVSGIIIFVVGFIINQYHDKILIGLRKSSNNEYKIPYGGLFRFVSCPNFLGEIIEWCGFLIFIWSLPAVSFVIWTIANLLPRALDHHKWYRKTFSDYPVKRRAIIPYLI
ncbi:MAG: DUF1295 domain-containing protein [Bacteroidales bacterium]|nr:DUF1295 domain-containing protein [Bacteroidales bacterium]